MNIWIGLLFLHGALPDVGLARELATEAAAALAPAPAEPAGRDRELQEARDAVALRAPSGVALR